jgi:hypothetical protein
MGPNARQRRKTLTRMPTVCHQRRHRQVLTGSRFGP